MSDRSPRWRVAWWGSRWCLAFAQERAIAEGEVAVRLLTRAEATADGNLLATFDVLEVAGTQPHLDAPVQVRRGFEKHAVPFPLVEYLDGSGHPHEFSLEFLICGRRIL